jgi:hypothetical protein
VDDDGAVRRGVCEYLQAVGYQVIEAENCAAAREVFRCAAAARTFRGSRPRSSARWRATFLMLSAR